jgi:uncharacterized OsmC-like protein
VRAIIPSWLTSLPTGMEPMSGPTPLETMLGALMSCTHVIAARIAHERGVLHLPR